MLQSDSLATGGEDSPSERMYEVDGLNTSADDPLDELRDRLVGRLLTPSDGAEYAAASRIFNSDPRCGGGLVEGLVPIDEGGSTR